MQHHALVAWGGIPFVEPSRCRRGIDADVRVVNRGMARLEFEPAHVRRSGAGDRDDEIAEHVGAAGGQRVGGKRQDHIRRSELPAAAPRRRREVGGISFRRTCSDPAIDQVNLGLAQPPLADERAKPIFGLPGRHVPAPGDGRDLRRPLFDLGIGDEAERRRSVRAMAAGAAVVEHRRDVPGKGGRRVESGWPPVLREEEDRQGGKRQDRAEADQPLHDFGFGSAEGASISPRRLTCGSPQRIFGPPHSRSALLFSLRAGFKAYRATFRVADRRT